MRTACEKNTLLFTTNDISAYAACFFMMLSLGLFQALDACLISPAAAHDPRPVLIDIYQDDARPGEMKLEWKIPGSLSPRKHPLINFATACNLIRTSPERFTGRPTMAGLIFFVQVTRRI